MDKKRRILVFLVTLAIMVTLISTTIGRDLLAGKGPSLSSFILLHFGGYLFFLLMPVEALVPFYLAQDHHAVLIFVLALVTAVAAQVIDYVIGYGLSEKLIGKWVKQKRLDKAERAINKWGDWVIFFFNATPLSSSVIMLAAGILRYNMKRAFFFSTMGLILKYTVLIVAVLFFI